MSAGSKRRRVDASETLVTVAGAVSGSKTIEFVAESALAGAGQTTSPDSSPKETR